MRQRMRFLLRAQKDLVRVGVAAVVWLYSHPPSGSIKMRLNPQTRTHTHHPPLSLCFALGLNYEVIIHN